jgi:preprotein translocase subunit YajC
VFFAASSGQSGGSYFPLLLLVGLFLLMYFMVIRPQSQRRKQLQQVQATIAPGAHVLTLSGLYGTVVDVGDTTLLLEVAPGVTNRFARSAVAQTLSDEEAARVGLPATDEDLDEDDAEFDGELELDDELDALDDEDVDELRDRLPEETREDADRDGIEEPSTRSRAVTDESPDSVEKR